MIDLLLHVAAGALFGFLLKAWWWIPVSTALATAGGFAREYFQHQDEFNWLNTHRTLEALAWGLGAAVGSTARYLIGVL